MKHVLLLVIVLVLIQACWSKKQEVAPTDDEAKLIAVSIPGFPSENIAIDQEKKQIVLTVPTSSTAIDFVARSYQTSPNSAIWNERLYPISLCRLSKPGEDQTGIYVLSNTNELAIYKFVVKPAGDLKIGFIDNHANALIAQPLNFQIENFLDGMYDGNVILTRTDAPESDTLQVNCCNAGCSETGPVQHQFNAGIPEQVRPGAYTVEIRKANGRQAIASQTLHFTKGTPLLTTLQFQASVLANSRNLTIRGENLFSDDSPALLFRRVTDESFRVKPTGISTFGRTLNVDLPADITPGYYYIQLIIRGQVVGSMYRFSVLRQSDQPSVASIDTLLTSGSSSPLVLQRTRYYAASVLPEYGPDKLEVKLTSLSNPNQTTVFTYRTGRFNSDYPSGLQIPASVQPGQYTLRIMATYATGTTVESEPLERTVIIQ